MEFIILLKVIKMVNYRYTNANIMHLKINTFKQIVIMLIFIAFSFIFFSQISIAASDYKWADKNHDSITGPNNTKYNSLGYACLIIFKTDGTLDGNKGAYPEGSDKDISTSYSNEAYSGVSKVPTCKDGKPASYVWIATNKKTAVVVKGNQDNKLVGVGAPYKGEASLWSIDNNGIASFKNNIANIEKPNNNVAPETDQTKQGSEEAQSEAQSGTQSQEANCSQALSPFGWVLCPATNFADNLYSFFKTLVNNLLFFESDKYENNGLYDSWKVMVTLANTVLVLVAIVMIAAQIFNFEFISAYTVKKALPRIVIAAILIQLSWFMVTTGIQIVNAIGSGLYWLLVAPFASKLDFGNTDGILEIGPILAQSYEGTDKGNTVGNAIVFYYAMVGLGAAAVGAALSGLWISIIIAAIGVVISLLVAIVTLVIREVLLIVLIAIAPLAIAFWILPGTNGLWNMWWKTFSRLLLMYPLIMLLFAGGTIAAILLASTGSGINILFAIIAFFVPMFMIGATYKFAGGAFASIANMTGKLGDKAKGSGMFGLKETAKRKREQSPWSLASQARKEQHRIEANKKFADLLGKDSPYGAVLRRKSGGGNVETIIARAQQQQIKDKSEDIDRIVSGDTSVLRDIVNNTARGPASAFNNDTYARIAAFQQLAKMGKTDASDFSSIGRMLRDDDVLRNKIVGDAAFTSGQAGNLTDGKIQSVSGTGEITYKDRIPDSASATANAIRNMPQEQLRFLATETVRDPKTGRDIDRFKDTNTRTYFDTREGAAYAVQLLTDPASSQNLTVNQKNVLRQQALRHGLTIPSSPNSGATQVPNPPHGPGTSGGTP